MTNLNKPKHETLKPCPFCGGVVAVKYAELHGYDKYVIRCCGVNILRATKEGAIDRWNTRAYGSQAIDDVKRLRAAGNALINSLYEFSESLEYSAESVNNFEEALAATDRPEYKEEG